jgi:hypothetical protein
MRIAAIIGIVLSAFVASSASADTWNGTVRLVVGGKCNSQLISSLKSGDYQIEITEQVTKNQISSSVQSDFFFGRFAPERSMFFGGAAANSFVSTTTDSLGVWRLSGVMGWENLSVFLKLESQPSCSVYAKGELKRGSLANTEGLWSLSSRKRTLGSISTFIMSITNTAAANVLDARYQAQDDLEMRFPAGPLLKTAVAGEYAGSGLVVNVVWYDEPKKLMRVGVRRDSGRRLEYVTVEKLGGLQCPEK